MFLPYEYYYSSNCLTPLCGWYQNFEVFDYFRMKLCLQIYVGAYICTYVSTYVHWFKLNYFCIPLFREVEHNIHVVLTFRYFKLWLFQFLLLSPVNLVIQSNIDSQGCWLKSCFWCEFFNIIFYHSLILQATHYYSHTWMLKYVSRYISFACVWSNKLKWYFLWQISFVNIMLDC